MVRWMSGFFSHLIGFFASLFDTDGFPARWDCGAAWQEQPALGWLHIVSDLAIFGAYLAIPVVLGYFLIRKENLPFPILAGFFAIFIVSCGVGHAVEAVIFWEPVYRLSGLVKVITAIVSWGTVIAMIPVIPRVLRLPDLEVLNAQLTEEIGQRKRIEGQLIRHSRQLEKSNQELDDFAYVASHDLRSPLQGVKNLANWIKDDNFDTLPDESKRHIDLMQQRIERMERLLDDLLQYSRVGRLQQSVATADVGDMLRGIIDSLPRPAEMTIAIAGELPTLETYIAPLDLTFRNLIQNAIKHHDRPDGKIEISYKDADARVTFCVRDDGPGIAPEYHQRIFKMFETLRPRDAVEGSGMGLSIVEKTVDRAGGKIWVESTPGAGTAFFFDWPKHPSAADES